MCRGLSRLERLTVAQWGDSVLVLRASSLGDDCRTKAAIQQVAEVGFAGSHPQVFFSV